MTHKNPPTHLCIKVLWPVEGSMAPVNRWLDGMVNSHSWWWNVHVHIIHWGSLSCLEYYVKLHFNVQFYLRNVKVSKRASFIVHIYLKDVVARFDISDIYPLAVNIMAVYIPTAYCDALFTKVCTFIAFWHTLKTEVIYSTLLKQVNEADVNKDRVIKPMNPVVFQDL